MSYRREMPDWEKGAPAITKVMRFLDLYAGAVVIEE